MKYSFILFALVLLFGCFTACHKPSDATTPPAQDTLLAWQKTTTASIGYSDIWFLSPDRGIAVGDALYNSSDSGKTWSKSANSPINNVNIQALNGQRGALLTQQGIYITDDFITWRVKSAPPINIGYASDLQFTSPSTCYVSSSSGLFKTVDTSNTWNKVYSNPVNGMFFFDDNTGIIYDYSSNPPSDVYKTIDGGAHWQALGYIPGHSNSYNTMQFVDPLHGWLSRGDSLFNTIDGGATWYGQRSRGGLIFDVQFLNNKIGYLAAGAEIFKTTDGGQTWILSCSLANEPISEIFFLDEKTGWACGGKGSILRLKQ
jgi:photosystem II stability/assembly factor-like uncharacterized protein